MGIKGLTDGPATLHRVRKLSIGIKDPGRGFPRKLDYFRVSSGRPIHLGAVAKGKAGDKSKPVAINGRLAPLHPDQIFNTAMRSYTASQLWCRGDNDATAERRGDDGRFHPVGPGIDGQAGCNGCPWNPYNHEAGWTPAKAVKDRGGNVTRKAEPVCKPNGRLYIVLDGEGATEATEISTNGQWSIGNVDGFIKRLTVLGPRAWTVPVQLRVAMQKMTVPGRSRTPLPVLSLHIDETTEQFLARAERAAAGRLLPEEEAPLMIAGPGVEPEARDEEPVGEAEQLLYPQAEPDHVAPEGEVISGRLQDLEDAAVRNGAMIKGRVLKRGYVAALFRARAAGRIQATDEQVVARLETAIRQTGAVVPGEEPPGNVVDAEFADAATPGEE